MCIIDKIQKDPECSHTYKKRKFNATKTLTIKRENKGEQHL